MSTFDLCSNCVEVSIPHCYKRLILQVEAGPLTPGTIYKYILKDKFGNRYIGNLSENVDGEWELDTDILREGLITPYSGAFTLTVVEDIQDCEPIELSIKPDCEAAAVATTCIVIEAVDMNDVPTKFYLPCKCNS